MSTTEDVTLNILMHQLLVTSGSHLVNSWRGFASEEKGLHHLFRVFLSVLPNIRPFQVFKYLGNKAHGLVGLAPVPRIITVLCPAAPLDLYTSL